MSRHREQLADPEQDVDDSIARAVATADGAVVFAGATVIIALAALAVTVLLAVLIAASLVPAALALFGERLRPRAHRTERAGGRARTPGSWGLAWGRAVTRKPLLVLLAGVIGLLTLAVPARDLRLGLPSNASQPVDSTQHKSSDLLTEGFGPGFNATMTAVVDMSGIPAADRASTVTELRSTLAGDRGVALAAQPVTNAESTLAVIAVIAVVPTTGPDTRATTDLVHRLRENAPAVAEAGGTLYMEYEVFLVSRMREHYEHTGDAVEAVTQGVTRSGRVVSAAALIMVAVFGGFVFNQITPDVDIEGAKLPGRGASVEARSDEAERQEEGHKAGVR
ncbi:MMPL family transporter [Streptomyces griseiscabiei]|uniref:MMPL family transporter n=1 Tax=Streptomyces griseiscabiei TaxID=2993540 RepID=A0ABU4L7H8_9ACTN|nr:MMPL family transporter [Streptomyces griseiscabiei]MDX2911295.1 MMPL family transporter [Streptomyces griseiscabiei]